MSLPGLLCLYLFFVVPLVTLLKIALSVRDRERQQQRSTSNGKWGNFSKAFTDFGSRTVAGVRSTPASPPCCAW